MNKQFIIDTAMRVSRERGYDMYIIYDSFEDSYSFTQDKGIYLTETEKIVCKTDGIELITL